MRNNIFRIFQKECHRFFRDRRMVFTVILMPALLMYAVYSISFSGIQSSQSTGGGALCYFENMPADMADPLDEMGFWVSGTTSLEEAKSQVETGELDLAVVFPENFTSQLTVGSEAQTIEVYCNSGISSSQTACDSFTAAMDAFEASIVDLLNVSTTDLVSMDAVMTQNLSTILPMAVISLLFSSCISVAAESIAGEKERGTIATLLVTPVRRRDLAIGKILSLSLFALLAGLSTFSSVLLSLQNSMGEIGGSVLQIYSITEFSLVLVLIIPTVLMAVSLLSVISATANSVKEVSTYSILVLIPVMITSLLPMLPWDLTNPLLKLIPMVNSSIGLSEVFAKHYQVGEILLASGSNLLYATGFGFLLTKMLNSEKFMFRR